MSAHFPSPVSFIIFVFFILLYPVTPNNKPLLKPYIIQLKSDLSPSPYPSKQARVSAEIVEWRRVIHSYLDEFNGVVASLYPDEVKTIAAGREVVSVWVAGAHRRFILHTTCSPPRILPSHAHDQAYGRLVLIVRKFYRHIHHLMEGVENCVSSIRSSKYRTEQNYKGIHIRPIGFVQIDVDGSLNNGGQAASCRGLAGMIKATCCGDFNG